MIEYAQEHPDAVYLTEDEASLYLQATTMAAWAPVGQTPVVKVAPQRDKCSFYGTLDLLTGEEIVTQVDKMNSEATASHLRQILAKYPDRYILLLWDRATWHGGAAVKQLLAENPRLEVFKYPPGAPDLNPQEHVWKAARSHISHNHNRTRLDELAQEFKQFLETHIFTIHFWKSSLLTQLRQV